MLTLQAIQGDHNLANKQAMCNICIIHGETTGKWRNFLAKWTGDWILNKNIYIHRIYTILNQHVLLIKWKLCIPKVLSTNYVYDYINNNIKVINILWFGKVPWKCARLSEK